MTGRSVLQRPLNRTIFTGDNLDVLRGLDSDLADLAYLDPPAKAAPCASPGADTGSGFKDDWGAADLDPAEVGLLAETEPALAETIQAAGSADGGPTIAYLTMMAVRLLELRRVLKPSGTVYLHSSPAISHYLKIVMDAVLGHDDYRNEIVWRYASAGGPLGKDFPRGHDIILRYGGEDRYYRQQRQPGGGNMIGDWWDDIEPVGALSQGHAARPAPKPLALLERIISASSAEGDLVLDPFCGHATACIAAENLGREWIGIDISEKSAQMVTAWISQQDNTQTRVVHRSVPLPVHAHRTHKRILYGQQRGRCLSCEHFFAFRDMDVELMVPVSRGGARQTDNQVLLCRTCARVKGDKLMADLKNAVGA